MTDKRHCTRCQAELPEGAPGNRCPKCLLELGLSDDVEEIGDSPPAAGPPAAPHAMEKPGDRIGRYKLLQQIGEGACGIVYLAEQQEPVRRRVALKIIKLGMDTKSVIARFEAEQQALALMEHPNIAQVLDAGTTETGRLYFVMELVRGIKITEYCDENHLSTAERLTLFTQVCRAVQHAHQKGVIHRDLKPSNILVTINDGVAVPKVIDFGIAKATNQQPLSDKTVFTAFDQFIGTPAYMSPEQALMTSLDIDTRSDIYSLGVLLYELLTGRTPFEAGDLLKSGLDEMRRTIREKEPAKPSTRLRTLLEPDLTTTAERRRTDPSRLVNTLRGDLDWIVMKALEKDRTRRYETANGLARDIQRHLNNEPVMARPPSTLYRFRKMVRRNKLAFAAGAAVVAALVIGFGVATWFLIRTLAAERQQTSLREQAERAEQGKTEELARTLLAVARASRQTGEPGRRFASLEAIAKAAAIRPSLELRNEAIAALALTDLGPARFGRDTPWTGTHSAGLATAFDSELRRVALFAQDGSIYVHRVADHAELLHIPPAETNRIAEDILLMFSPDDRHLAARYHDGAVRCWQLEPLRLRIDARPRSEFMFSFAFSPDSRWLLAGESSQELYVYSLAEAWPSATTDAPMSRPARILKLSIQPDLIAFDPTGTRLAISGGTPVQILKWPGGELLRSFSDMNRISSSIWHPDSRQLFVGTWQGTIDVLDSLQPSSRSLAGHHPVVNWLALHPRGDVLASHSWDGTTKLWEMAAAVPSLSTEEGLALRFSSDGRRLGFHHGTHRYGVWPVALSRVFRSLAGVSTPRDRASLDFTPDGRVLLWADQFGLWWADLHEGAYDHRKVPGLSYARFNADATAVLLVGDGGLKRWSLRESSSSGSTGLQLAGEAEPLGTNHFSLSWPMHVPPNRSLMIAAEESSPAFQNRVLIMDAGGGQRVIHSPEDARVFYTALSPDERWLALGHYIGSTYVLDARNGATVKSWPELQHADVSFTPDGRWLVTGTRQGYEFWETGTWRPGLRVERGIGVTDPGRMAFSRDGRVLAIVKGLSTIELLDWRSGQIIADLIAPQPQHVLAFAFSQDDSILAVIGEDALHLWDLRALREELAALHLDWSQPPCPPGPSVLGTVVFHQKAESPPPPLVIPPRSVRAPEQLLDLTSFYTAPLAEAWEGDNNLAALPVGLQTIGGVPYDLRGVIWLRGRYTRLLPQKVEAIPVRQRCRRLHFLHTTAWKEPDGTEIGAYRLHFADGERAEVPIVYGRDVRNWWLKPGQESVGLAPAVWTGTNVLAAGAGYQVNVFHTSWENPRPDVQILRLDFVSAETQCPPCLLAITAE